MTEQSIVEMAIFALTGLFVVLWYLLQQKDAKQQHDIELLWSKHDTDVEELKALKLQIAQQHYVKDELDKKFDRMECAFREGFKDMSGKFDQLSQVLLAHFKDEK